MGRLLLALADYPVVLGVSLPSTTFIQQKKKKNSHISQVRMNYEIIPIQQEQKIINAF